MSKAAIFDLDGTLLDTLYDLADSANHALGICGYPLRSRMEIRAFVGNGVKKLIDRCLPDENEEKRSRVLEIFKEHYRGNMTNKTAPYPGIMEALTKLREAGYSLAIVSNKFDAAVKSLSKLYFDGVIDVAIGESDTVRKKPAPDSVFKAMELLGTSPEESVYIGDSDVDVETAHNAGLRCIGVTWGFRDRDILEEAGADIIAENADMMTECIIRRDI